MCIGLIKKIIIIKELRTMNRDVAFRNLVGRYMVSISRSEFNGLKDIYIYVFRLKNIPIISERYQSFKREVFFVY